MCVCVCVEGGGLSDLVRSSLAKLSGPDQLVAASAAGDIDTLTNFLTNNPEHVSQCLIVHCYTCMCLWYLSGRCTYRNVLRTSKYA